MRKLLHYSPIIILSAFFIQACSQAPQENYSSEWLGASKQEMVDNIEEQFQGFSATMRETSYRYYELYWAGTDQNWGYAEYQREHIIEALDQGFIRRPEHKPSAQQFLGVNLPEMKEVIESEDQEAFFESFTRLTASCNTCHSMEDVAFITVKIPQTRNTVVHY